MIDRERGRIFGVNLVDLILILVVLFGVVSYISKPQEQEYKGNQMYSAIQDFQRLDSRGFLVKGDVKGTYLWDGSAFNETGILLPSTSGRLRLRKQNGDIVVIGGERAYLEDVAAQSIRMEPIDDYLVVFTLGSQSFESYQELISYLASVKEDLGAEHLYVDAEIAVDSPLTPSEREKVAVEIATMYRARNNYLSRTEPSGFVMNLGKAELDELTGLSITEGAVTTNRMRLYAGYNEKPAGNLPPEAHVVSAKSLL